MNMGVDKEKRDGEESKTKGDLYIEETKLTITTTLL